MSYSTEGNDTKKQYWMQRELGTPILVPMNEEMLARADSFDFTHEGEYRDSLIVRDTKWHTFEAACKAEGIDLTYCDRIISGAPDLASNREYGLGPDFFLAVPPWTGTQEVANMLALFDHTMTTIPQRAERLAEELYEVFPQVDDESVLGKVVLSMNSGRFSILQAAVQFCINKPREDITFQKAIVEVLENVDLSAYTAAYRFGAPAGVATSGVFPKRAISDKRSQFDLLLPTDEVFSFARHANDVYKSDSAENSCPFSRQILTTRRMLEDSDGEITGDDDQALASFYNQLLENMSIGPDDMDKEMLAMRLSSKSGLTDNSVQHFVNMLLQPGINDTAKNMAQVIRKVYNL